MEECGRVAGCVAPVGDRDPAEVLRCRPVLVHVAGGEHAGPLCRCEQAERRGPAERDVVRLGALVVVLDTAAEPVPRALVERPVGQHIVGGSGVHCHGGHRHRGASATTAVVDHAEEPQPRDAQIPGHIDLVVALHAEQRHAVDRRRVEAGVGTCGQAGLGGQLHRGPPGVLRELGGADADDGRLAGRGPHVSEAPAAPVRHCRGCGCPTSWRRRTPR